MRGGAGHVGSKQLLAKLFSSRLSGVLDLLYVAIDFRCRQRSPLFIRAALNLLRRSREDSQQETPFFFGKLGCD